MAALAVERVCPAGREDVTSMRVERFSDWAAPGIGEAGWNRLVEQCRAPVPFATWQFQTAWFRAFAPGPLHLLAAQDGAGEWVGLLPLYETPMPDGAVLRLVGGTDISDYLDLIAAAGREEEVWKAMLPVIGDLGWHTVDLRPVPAASPTSSLVAGLAAAAGLRCRVDVEERCPVIELADTWDGYLATLPGKDRHELRRKIRRAEAGRPRIEVARSADAMSALMDGFVALHRLSKVGKAKFMDEPMEKFFRELGCGLAESGLAALWMLWLEDRPAAALVCLEQAGSVSLYNSGFDPEARAMSPGVVLIARTIEDAIARGFRRYDFLRGEEPYKYGFGAAPTEVLRLTLERS
jgi:CelD/BcsL family acetyltransferase involved in cellulose biosynthesis